MALVAVVGGVCGAQARRTEIGEAIPTGWMMPPVALERMPGDEWWLG